MPSVTNEVRARMAAALCGLARARGLHGGPRGGVPAEALVHAMASNGVHVTERTARSWLRGENDVPSSKMPALAAALGTDVAAILRKAGRIESEKISPITGGQTP